MQNGLCENRLDEQWLKLYTVRVYCDHAKKLDRLSLLSISDHEQGRQQDITCYKNRLDFIVKSCTLENKSSFS